MASCAVDVYVKLPSGRTSVIQLLPSNEVDLINKHVATEENVPDNRVILKYQGKILDRKKQIGGPSGYGIRPETILKGEVVFPKEIELNVKLLDGRCVPVTVLNTDCVSTIQSSLNGEDFDSINHQLKFSDRVIDLDKPFFTQGVTEECILTVKEKPKPKLKNGGNVEEEPSEEIKESVLSSFASNGRNVEVVFSFDTTGSMSSYIQTVRRNLDDTCRRLLRDIPNIRIGLIAHGDYCDQNTYVIRQMDLTSNVEELVDFANNTPSTGGGDSPECYEWVLHKAKFLDWSEDSAKALVVIGDAEPHPPSYTDQHINWWNELEILAGMGIKIYGVQCNTSNNNNSNFYQELARQTDGRFLNLRHFNLITEMFLAVCYNEAAPEQLEAYTEELDNKGKLTEETRILMKEIAEKSPPKSADKPVNEKKKLHLNWWDVENCDWNTVPEYTYNIQTDTWSKYTAPRSNETSSPSVSPSPVHHVTLQKSKSKKSKDACVIM